MEPSSLSFFKKNLVIPSQLVGKEGAERKAKTVYTVRITTGHSRGSGLDEPLAGVQLCLVGANGSAVLHRVSPVFDPEALQEELEAIREVLDGSIGANRKAMESAATMVATVPSGKSRFQPGSVDEISFLGPEIGPIQCLLVAPEQGSWRLEEATVSSSRSRHTDRFVCGDMLGNRAGTGYLAAVSPDAVVYGSGESLAVLTRSQARELHEAGMGRYSLFKARLMQVNTALVGIGASLTWLFGGADVASDFAAGGAAGLAYQWLLQKGVDELSLTQSPLYHKAKALVPRAGIKRFIASGGLRIMFVFALAFLAAYATSAAGHVPSPIYNRHTQVEHFVVGAAGFLMYKLALVGVLLVPPLLREDGQ